jgi:hypothetical protein
MPRIHRKKKDSEGGKDGGHYDSEEGEVRRDRKPNTTTAKSF